MSSPLARFFSKPATYKVLVFVIGYLVFYLLVGQLIALVSGDTIDDDNVVSSTGSILLALTIPVLVGAAALVWFVRHMGWSRDVFGRQPVTGSRWMWIAPILVVIPIIGHLAHTDWSDWTAGEIAALALLGLGVGVAEEVATRGVVVKMLRDAAHREKVVAAVSSLAFSLMHLANLLSGMDAKIVVSTVVYTFGFGMCMYLTMRVTGTIWAAVVLHGLTDPTTILSTGGLDAAVSRSGDTTMALITALATFALVGFGIVAVFLVRGHVADGPAADRLERDEQRL